MPEPVNPVVKGRWTRIRRWHLIIAAVAVIELLLTALTLVNVSEVRAVNRERQAAAASVELLMSPPPLRASDLLVQRARAYLTHDNVTTRAPLRQSFRDYRYAAAVLPSDYQALGISRLNPAGTHAIVLGEELGQAGEAGHADVYDLTADPPTATRLPVSPDGLSPTRLSWLGPDHLVVLAGPTVTVWELNRGLPTAVIEPAGLNLAEGRLGSLVTGASGRWVGWTDPAAAEVHVLDLSAPSAPPGVVRLPAKIAVRQSEEPDPLYLLGLTPTGEVTVRHRDTVLDLSPDTATPVPDPPPGYPVTGDGRTHTVECRAEDGYRLRSVLSGEVLAEQPAPEVACEPGRDSAAFSPDGRHVALIPRAGGPLYLGRPGTDLRELPIPLSTVERVAAEPDGGYRVALLTGGELVVLRIPPMDRLDRALAGADSGLVTEGTGLLLLHSDDLLEVWHPDSRRRLAAMTVEGLAGLEGGSRVTSSSDGRLLALTPRGSTAVQLLDLPDLTPTGTIEPVGLGENIHVVDVDRERRLLVKRALSYSVWTDTGEPLSAELPIPVDMPTAHVYLRPGHAEVVAIADGTLRRYDMAGAELPGSLIDLGGDDRTGPSGRPGWTAIDRTGRYLALLGLETLDVWELDTGRSVGHLPLTPGELPPSLAGLAFDDDPHLIHIAVSPDLPASLFAADSDPLSQLTWRWHDSSLRHRLTPWVRFPADPVWTAGDERPAWRPYLATALELEPTDPRVWLRRICDLISNSPKTTAPLPPPPLPEAAYAGPVCSR